MKRSRILFNAVLGLSLMAGCRHARMSQCEDCVYMSDEILVGPSATITPAKPTEPLPMPKGADEQSSSQVLDYTLPNVSTEPPMLAMPVGPAKEPKKRTPSATTTKPTQAAQPEIVWRTSPAVPMKPVEARPAVPARTTQQSVLDDRRTAAVPPTAPQVQSEAEPQEQPAKSATAPVVSQKPSVSTGERKTSGDYGHAADYGWLQGVVDRHYRGHIHLRYGDLVTEDQWGGKVRLDDDPRLNDLQTGDVVVVEGVLTPPDSKHNTWARYPHFHINNVWVVQKRN